MYLPEVCRILLFSAYLGAVGPSLYLLLRFRYRFSRGGGDGGRG